MENESQATPNSPKTGIWVAIVIAIIIVAFVYKDSFFSTNTNSIDGAIQNVNAAHSNTLVDTNTGTNTNVAVNTNSTQTSEVDITSWETYENRILGFQIKYPPEFVVFQEQLDGEEKYVRFIDKQYLESEVSFPSVMVSVWRVDEGTVLTEWVENSLSQISYETIVEDITTKQGLAAKTYQFGSTAKKVSIKDQNQIYTISFSYHSETDLQNQGEGFIDTFEIL